MHFMGIDIGSSYTKLSVISGEAEVVHQCIVKTMNRDKNILAGELVKIEQEFAPQKICATGYGRDHFKQAQLRKTEIYCASAGVSHYYPIEKTILDIGGEDIKVIKSAANGKVQDFYMNSKCAAGTGTFIVEIAERAELPLAQMSELASRSSFGKELNSFCTVFAKTEIMQWIFDEVPPADLARGIYLSIVNRIAKLRIDKGTPLFVVGGVIAHHPILKTILEDKFKQEVIVPTDPQLINSLGAALLAGKEIKNAITQTT